MPSFPALHDNSLHAAGLTGSSLVCSEDLVWLPFDVAREIHKPVGLRPLARRRTACCASEGPFRLDWPAQREVHILNASGVALGDAIVAFSVLCALKARHPHVDIVMHQARYASHSVRQLAELAAPYIGTLRLLPQPLASIPEHATLIDLGDFAYWRSFDQLPMFDFFAKAFGTTSADFPEDVRRNAWLAGLALPSPPKPWRDTSYALFAPLSTSPLREIAPEACGKLVQQIAEFYDLPVLGCADLEVPHYLCITEHSRNTAQFLGWIRHAQVLISTDTAALHAAAGLEVPTLAGFVSIDPALRSASYPLCTALDLRQPELQGLHHSDDPKLVAIAREAWLTALEGQIPWPAARPLGNG